MHTEILITTVLYLALSLIVGFWKLRAKDYSSFVASPGAISKYAVSLSICGTVIGGGMFFTVAQMGNEAGLAVLALPISYIIGYALLAWLVPQLREMVTETEASTLYDVVVQRLNVERNWGQRYAIALSSITFFLYLFMLAAQFTIVANFYMDILNISETTAWFLSLVVVGGTTLIYSVAGGIKKDIATDVFQVIIVMAGIFLLAFYLCTSETVVLTNAPDVYYTFSGYGAAFPIAVIVFSPAYVGRFDYWQRMIAAKSSKDAKSALWMSIPLIVVSYIVFCLVGVATKSMAPDIPSSDAALWFIQNMLPQKVSLLVTLAFYAALMSTSDTLLNVSSVSLASTVKGCVRSQEGFFNSILFVRLLTVVVATVASLAVLFAADTVDLIIGGFSSLVILSPGLIYTFTKEPWS